MDKSSPRNKSKITITKPRFISILESERTLKEITISMKAIVIWLVVLSQVIESL